LAKNLELAGIVPGFGFTKHLQELALAGGELGRRLNLDLQYEIAAPSRCPPAARTARFASKQVSMS
jgi:hypothetical protein